MDVKPAQELAKCRGLLSAEWINIETNGNGTGTMNSLTVGDHIKQARLDYGLSIKQLARAAKVDDSWLSKVERGIVSGPDPSSLDRLAAVLGLDTADLFAIVGYSSQGLPRFVPYLRAKYDLPDDAIDQLEAEFERINERYRLEQGQNS